MLAVHDLEIRVGARTLMADVSFRVSDGDKIGLVGRNAQGVQGISLLVMFPLTFLSNAFVPTDTVPRPLEAFAEVNPVSLVITALRDLANDGQVTSAVAWALLGCAVVVAVFAPLSVRRFKKM